MTKRIVVALGGNAILTKDASATAQQIALIKTANQLAALLTANSDWQVIITHGNGPQVVNLLLQQQRGSNTDIPAMPLYTVGAMTQGAIGLWLANALNQAFMEHGLDHQVAALITRTLVDGQDKAFQRPTKPIGPFYSPKMAEHLQDLHPDWTILSDAGRGYRRMVPSPQPLDIIEAPIIQQLVSQGVTLIAAGGGGIPVVRAGSAYVGIDAVIDKDYSAAKLAELVGADILLILTTVQNVYINYDTPQQTKLTHVTVAQAQEYLDAGHFAPGSMQPKIQAAMNFVRRTNKTAVITSLANVTGYLQSGLGTIITN
ncbi:carbamate kinase [Periweissella ghanensis]|uniref:Carbamate kinase n=1 Tax=Periweissella ghanensis TaxID=467997 RepID=A0ABN8BNF1_9LACO|nr:carbamate kinase [Periweissella ghanensis]MCM0600421.1 carbamate kinase [Periweissella ghanensis]CAH0418115.1 Carbamate kinase 1 [Periweissella ghanensis]